VYVAAQGALHAPSETRGIYKSTDGGKNWERVLFVNSLTGCSELSMDLNNPQVLYATMWEHQRKPWIVVSGGEGSGVYKSSDGGETWKQIHEGLPEEKGKMAIAVSRSNSDKVYALVESDSQEEKGGLFVSSDAGDMLRRSQSHVLPGFSGIGRFVNAISMRGHDTSGSMFAHAYVDNIRIAFGDGDGTDRACFEITIGNVLPVLPGIFSFPESATCTAQSC